MANIDNIAVLTSENVRLNYSLAGMGTRVLAFLADAFIVGLTWFAAEIIFRVIDPNVGSLTNIGSGSQSMLTGIYYITIFLIIWGYFFFFEWINWGQTPGKSMLGIRVASADGGPAGIMACAIRNILRMIDIAFAALGITFFILIFTPKYQRLGDLAAGTVVVRRRRLEFDEVLNAARSSDQAQAYAAQEAAKRMQGQRQPGFGPVETGVRIRIEDSERVLIEKFMERRVALPADVRKKLARDLAGRIRSRLPGDALGQLTDEQVLETAIASNPR